MTSRDIIALGDAIRKNTGVKSMEDTLKDLGAAAAKKGKAPIDRIIVTGFMAGAFVAFGAYLMLLTGGNLGDAYPEGIKKLVCGLVFPLGIILVVYCGTDLFTGNTLILPLGNMLKTVHIFNTIKVWIICYLGNLLGALFVAFVFVYLLVDTETVSSTEWGQTAIKIAEKKMNKPIHQLIISGVAANWMVCTSVFIGARSRGGAGKIFALWWPIFAFVCMGFEHCIANCFFIPLGIFFGAEGGYYFLYNLVFSTIGNIIGGTLFTAFIIWYIMEGYVSFKNLRQNMWNMVFPKKTTEDVEGGNVEEVNVEEDDIDDIEMTDTSKESTDDLGTTTDED